MNRLLPLLKGKGLRRDPTARREQIKSSRLIVGLLVLPPQAILAHIRMLASTSGTWRRKADCVTVSAPLPMIHQPRNLTTAAMVGVI